jgi:hypothetical protein
MNDEDDEDDEGEWHPAPWAEWAALLTIAAVFIGVVWLTVSNR